MYKHLKGAGTVVAEALNVGSPLMLSVSNGCLIVGEENAVCFFSLGLKGELQSQRPGEMHSRRITPAEINLKHMVLHDICFCGHLCVCFQPGNM